MGCPSAGSLKSLGARPFSCQLSEIIGSEAKGRGVFLRCITIAFADTGIRIGRFSWRFPNQDENYKTDGMDDFPTYKGKGVFYDCSFGDGTWVVTDLR